MKFANNVIWTFSGTIGIQLLGLLVNIILARLLTPEIFGIVNLALIIIVFLQIIQEAGLSTILIQKKELTKSLITTVFYMNIIFSVILCFILIISAENLALFFGYEQIEQVLYYSVIGLLIGSLGVTNRGILVRNSQFKVLSIINVISEIIGIIFTFIFLYYGNYLLAIGIRIISRPAIQSLIMMLLYGLKGAIGKPELGLLREIMPFSSNVLGISILNYFKNNIDSLFIGKVIGSEALGFYTLAFQWSTIAKFYISGSIAKVLLPEIAKDQDDLMKIRKLFIKVVEQVSFVMFPFCVGLFLIAPEFILVVYGKQWESAIPILRILMLGGLIASFGTLIGKVYEGLGRPGIALNITFISVVVFMPLLFLGSFYGLQGVAYAVLVHAIIFDFLLVSKALNLLDMPVKTFFHSLKSVFYSTLFVVIFYSLIKSMFFPAIGNLASFIWLLLIQLILYYIASLLFNKSLVISFSRILLTSLNIKSKNSFR